MTIDDVEHRYLHDPIFHHLVSAIEAMIETLQCTPTETREACMYAQMRVESRHPRTFVLHADGTIAPVREGG